jgi:hypothetical protein
LGVRRAAGFLDLNSAPTDVQIDQAMSGNVPLRYLSTRIRAAVKTALKLQEPELWVA